MTNCRRGIPSLILSPSQNKNAPMTIHIKTPEEIEKMRVAGRLASEVLDYIVITSYSIHYTKLYDVGSGIIP